MSIENCGEQFFGIVYDGRLYFKTHIETLPDYLHHHAEVFAPSERAWQLCRI